MTSRRTLKSAGVLATLGVAAMGLAFLVGCSNAARPASSGSVAPTSSIGQPANTLQDALNQARNILEAGPPYVALDEVGSFVYVATTYGQVVSLRKFNGIRRDEKTPPFPDGLPVWLFVAYGPFQDRSMPGSTTPGQTYSTRYMVIPKGQVGLSTGVNNEQYDLSQLGTAVQVPVPLPPFPTPVRLNSR
jgi:hypothetical protein